MKETKFKQTEVGMIPSDWEIKPLKDIAGLKAGKMTSYNDFNPKYPCFGGNGIRAYLSHYSHDGIYPIIGRQGELCGNVNLAKGKFYATEHAVVASPKKDIDAIWLYYQLTALNLNQYATGCAQPGLSVEKINDVYTQVPPTIEEQQRIANALSDVDTLIANLEKLIAKKKNIKQGAMQQLLTGKKRLPGFAPDKPTYKQTELGKIPTDWEVKKIGDFCSVKDGTHGTYARHDKGCLLLSAKNILDNRLLITNDESFVSEKDYTEITANGYPQKGDILVSCVGSIGRCCILETDEKIAFQRSVAFVRNKSASTRFLMYAIQGESAQAQLEESKNASTLGGVYLSALSDIELMLPTSLDEQTAIANVLSDMDTEISALETKLAKYRTLKTGMMQQLLTGKIRLV